MYIEQQNKYKITVGFVILAYCLFVFSAHSIAQKQYGQNLNSSSADQAVKIPPPLLQKSEQGSAQYLETQPLKILASGKDIVFFDVEITKTPEEFRKGLMFRESLEKNTGMLFVFPEENERSFWMKNTLISLDIIFIRQDGTIHRIHPNAEAGSLERIKSNGPAYAVLELGGGEAERLGIVVGDKISHQAFQDAKYAK